MSKAVITGLGMVTSAGIGKEKFLKAIKGNRRSAPSKIAIRI